MKITQVRLGAALVTAALSGCLDAANAIDDSGVAGGPGAQLSADIDNGPSENAAPFAADRPCGDATVATVPASSGTRLSFCAFEDGLELIFEDAPLGSDSQLANAYQGRPRCGLEAYLDLTAADIAVPAALVRACPLGELRQRAQSERAVVAKAVILDVPELPAQRSHYCGSNGANEFSAERCWHCDPYADCVDWCVTQAWGWHDRTMSGSAFLGEEGNVAVETNASCGKRTRLRGYYREDVGDSWQLKYDLWLNANYWRTTALIYHSVALFGQDYDLRLRANSESGAYHRHSGYFLDE